MNLHPRALEELIDGLHFLLEFLTSHAGVQDEEVSLGFVVQPALGGQRKTPKLGIRVLVLG